MKSRFASLYFKGSAATWLKTMERRVRIADWTKLCDLVMAKYDKDQYQILLKQLDSLKQATTVLEYKMRSRSLPMVLCSTTLQLTIPSL
jgi:hypothetical protein